MDVIFNEKVEKGKADSQADNPRTILELKDYLLIFIKSFKMQKHHTLKKLNKFL